MFWGLSCINSPNWEIEILHLATDTSTFNKAWIGIGYPYSTGWPRWAKPGFINATIHRLRNGLQPPSSASTEWERHNTAGMLVTLQRSCQNSAPTAACGCVAVPLRVCVCLCVFMPNCMCVKPTPKADHPQHQRPLEEAAHTIAWRGREWDGGGEKNILQHSQPPPC